jgi:hypothetical protein
MKIVLSFIMAFAISLTATAQTFHAMIFSDMKESAQRAADRTMEMNNMRSFCQNIATALGYRQDIRCHSDNEFTSTQFIRDVESMAVGPDDIVVFFYNGHGCNWDDDDWPHMCFRDKQYWQTTAYEILQERCGNAKLLLSIACCCNMDSRGRAGYDWGHEYGFDNNKVRALFTGFYGKQKIVTSSSIRGQYSYSWASGNRLGSIYGISLREAISEILNPASSLEPTWENALSLAQRKTLYYTDQKQKPQYAIHVNRQQPTTSSQKHKVSPPSGKPIYVKIFSTTLQKDVNIGGIPCLVVNVDFNIENISADGGRVVAFLESPKGVGVKDTNGRFCTTGGKVCFSKEFGTRQPYSTFRNFQLAIPMEELHITNPSKDHFIRVAVYDYASKKYVKLGQYVTL